MLVPHPGLLEAADALPGLRVVGELDLLSLARDQVGLFEAEFVVRELGSVDNGRLVPEGRVLSPGPIEPPARFRLGP